MLQCKKCLQWFHAKCIRTPYAFNLLLGDRFFDFVCCLCTGTSEEQMDRIHLNWTDALHLVLFNLTIIKRKKFHDIDSCIIPFFRSHWKSIAPWDGTGEKPQLKSKCLNDLNFLCSVLSRNKSRFTCGSEVQKKSTFWGLRKVGPPIPPGLSVKGVDCQEFEKRNI